MKKVVLFAFVLAVCGVFHNSVLAQQLKQRYLVTYARSAATSTIPIRSATAVTVVNQSFKSCPVQVQWFPGGIGGTTDPVCTAMAMVDAGTAHQFCTRPLNGLITTCNADATCSGPEAITGVFQGAAVVSSGVKSSSDEFDCSLIGVEARVYYTTGANDGAISAISNSKVVFFGEGNLGD